MGQERRTERAPNLRARALESDPLPAPLNRHVGLAGKLAVVTGASRGNGRAIGDALTERGVDVIGTSRNPATVPTPPRFPLVQLDVADPISVATLPARLAAVPVFRSHSGVVDILANNAGRFVLGNIVPISLAQTAQYWTQRELAVRTLYSGHVMVTNTMLPLLSDSSYARILFTASSASDHTDVVLAGASILDGYAAAKAALRVYATNLGAALSGTHMRVTTVYPQVTNTALAVHPNPIYTRPVDTNGLSGDKRFDDDIAFLRATLAGGLPPTTVGETYAQILAMTAPPPNVAVAAPDLASQGQNELIQGQMTEGDTRRRPPSSADDPNRNPPQEPLPHSRHETSTQDTPSKPSDQIGGLATFHQLREAKTRSTR